MAKNTDDGFFESGYRNIIRFYKNEKKTDEVIKIYETVITKHPENTHQLNSYAWYIYENKISKKYERGIELAVKAVQLKPDGSGIWDTLAWLYFENGNIDKAVESINKAIELKPDEKYYRESLEKIKQGKS